MKGTNEEEKTNDNRQQIGRDRNMAECGEFTGQVQIKQYLWKWNYNKVEQRNTVQYQIGMNFRGERKIAAQDVEEYSGTDRPR